MTCSIVGSGTITNNSCLLRNGQIVSLYNLFPVTPAQYFEFEGYYVNGVLVSNPKSYYVFDDVKIEARIKEIPVANLLCVILGNGTLSNNSCVLRVGDTVNLITLFQVTPSQYYEFDGYYVNGVLIPNPSNYIVLGDVQIEARTKEILRSEIIVRFGESIISDALFTYYYQTNNESWREGYIIADSKPSSTINTTTGLANLFETKS